METHITVFSTQVPQENEGSMASWPTSSILKVPKHYRHREPLQDLNIRLCNAEDTSSTGQLRTKRVSFHKAIQTKEFHVEEAATSWASTYEETVKSSDASSENDSSCLPGHHILYSNINASFLLKSCTTRDDLRDRKEMKHHGDCLGLHTVNREEGDSEDKLCFSQNEIHVCNQSNDMDFTEPLDGILLTLKQTGLLANEIGNTELLKSLQQNSETELSSAFYQKLETTEQIDMTLTGTLPHVHIKSQEKSEENFRSCVTKPHFLVPMSSRKEVDEVNQNQTYNYKISSQSRHVDDMELKCRLNNDISIPLRKSDKPSDTVQIFSKAVDVDHIEFIHKRQQTQAYKPEEETSPVCNVIDMELTSDNKWNEMYYQEVVNRYVGNMALSRERPQKQSSNPTEISSHTGIVSDMELRSGIKRKELCKAVQMNGYISDDELTSQWPQKQISNPIEVPCHTGNERGMELTSGIKQKETCKAVGINRYVSDKALRSERPQQQTSHQTDLSSDGNVSEMELTSEIKQKGMCHEVEVRKYVSDMELPSEMSHKQVFNPTGVSSHVGNLSNMELTCGRKQKEMCNAVEAYRYVSHFELTSERPQKQMSHQTDLSGDGNVSDMELSSEIKQKGMHNEVMRKYVNDMELRSEMTPKEMSCPVNISNHGDVSDMELTSGMKWEKTCNAVEVNKYVSDMELTNEMPHKQIFNPLGVSSHVGNASNMELTCGRKQKEMCKAVEVNKYVSDLELTSERPQKQMSHQTDLSSDGNVSDMELSSEIKQKGMHNEVMRKYVNDMELRSEMTPKEMSCPVNISNHGDVSDMELTSGMKWKKTCNAVEVNKYVSDMELTSEMPLKQIFNPIGVSSHVGNVSNTEVTCGIKQKEMCKAVEVNKYVSDLELTIERPQKQMSHETDLSSDGNVSDMELSSEIKQKGMHNEVMRKYVNDMELRSEMTLKEMSCPVNISNHGDVSDMELTSGMKWEKTCNAVEVNKYVSDMELTSEMPLKQIFNPIGVSSHVGNVSNKELTCGRKQKEMCNAVEAYTYVSHFELTSERPQKQLSHETDLSSDGNVSDMELSSEIKQKGMGNEAEVRKHVSYMELRSEMTQKEMSCPVNISNHGDVSDMEFTSGIKQKGMGNEAEVRKHVSYMELTSDMTQKEMSCPVNISNHGDVSDMELTSGMKWKKMCNAVEVNKCVSDLEQTSERSQKQIFKPIGVSSLVGNVSNMELTCGRKQKQTYNAAEVNSYVSHLELTSERSQKQISNLTELSSGSSDSDVELTSIMKQKEMCNEVEVTKYINDKDLVSETMLKEMSCPVDISGLGDVSDMELTSGMKWLKMCNAVEVNRYVSDLELTSEKPQKQMSHQTDLSSDDNVSDMEFTSGIKQKGMGNEAEVRKHVSYMELMSDMTQKEMSCQVNISNHGDVSDMDLTSGMKWQKKRKAVEVNRYISDVELTCEMPHKQIFNAIAVCSHVGNVSNMELTCGRKQKETYNAVEVSRCVSHLELTSERPQKQIFNPTELSSNGNVSDMELTSGITQKGIGNEVELRKYVNDMELRSEITQKEMSCPADISNHGNASDMELTSGIKWKKAHNTVEVDRYISDMELTSERPQKEISNATGVSSLISSDTGMELTRAMNSKETHNAVEINRYVSNMALTSEGPHKKVLNPLDVSNHGNVSDMELTSGIKWKKTHNAVEVNRYVSDMELTSERPQKEISNATGVSSLISSDTGMELTRAMNSKETHNVVEMNRYVSNMALTSEGPHKEVLNPLDVSNHDNVSDMELTSGMTWKETCTLREVSQSVTDIELGSQKRWKQTSSPIEMSSHSNISDMGLRSGVKWKEIYDEGDASDMEQSDSRESGRSAVCAGVDNLDLRNEVTQKDMELWGVNLNGIYNQYQVVSKYANSSKTEYIQSVYHKQNDIHTETHSETNNINDSEDIKQHSENEVCISPCGDKNTDEACQPDHVQAKTSLRNIILSEESTVETPERNEKFLAQGNSVTLVTQTEGKNDLPFSKVTLASTDGRYCEQGISVLEVEGINESGNCKSMGFQVENHISAKTSVTAVGLNLSNPLNTKKLGEISDECDIPKLNQWSVNRSIKNPADKSGHSQGKYDLENVDSSSNKVTQVSQTCQIDNSITKENLSMHRQLSEASTCTFYTTGAIKELAVGYDSIGNAASNNIDSVGNTASHDIREVQYARKRVHEKTQSQESSLENTQMFKSHNSNSLLLEELDVKQGHATNKPALCEYLESSGLRVRPPPELQAFQTVKQPRSITPAKYIESVESNQNLSYLQLENTSIPDEMEFNIIRDLSHETDESYMKLVECVTMADKCVREKVSMTSNENAMLGNSQSTEQNCKDRTSLLEEMKNDDNTLNEPVTRGQKGSPGRTPVKSSSKQMCEQSTPKNLSKDTDEDVTIASVEKQIKEEELRSGCVWNIKEMSDALWSFHFLYKSLMLILKLNPCETNGSSKVVMDIQLISHATEKADPRVKFVHNILLKKFHIQALKSMCKTALDVPEVLETISCEVKKMKLFVKDITELEALDLLQIENNCASFDIADLHIHAWFRIKVNLDKWEDISPADVSVENVIGNVKEDELTRLVTAATRGPSCLKDYVRLIKDYVEVLAKK